MSDSVLSLPKLDISNTSLLAEIPEGLYPDIKYATGFDVDEWFNAANTRLMKSIGHLKDAIQPMLGEIWALEGDFEGQAVSMLPYLFNASNNSLFAILMISDRSGYSCSIKDGSISLLQEDDPMRRIFAEETTWRRIGTYAFLHQAQQGVARCITQRMEKIKNQHIQTIENKIAEQ